MTLAAKPHAEVVDAWLGDDFERLSTLEMLAVLETGFEAIWKRAQRTLGDITLRAIGERVLADAVAAAPLLAGAELHGDGLRCTPLGAAAGDVSAAEVHAAVRFTLIALLQTLGTLTAGVLTPLMHAELAKTQWQTGGVVRHRFGKAKHS